MESFSKRFRLVLRQIVEDFIGKQVSDYFRWNHRMSLRKELFYVSIFVFFFCGLLLLIIFDYASGDGLTPKEGETILTIGLLFSVLYAMTFAIQLFLVGLRNTIRYFIVAFKKVEGSTLSERINGVTEDIKLKSYSTRKNRFISFILITTIIITLNLLLIFLMGIGSII